MTIERTVGLILVLSAVVTFPGLMMFTFRRGYRGGAPRSRVHFIWERSFVMAGVILCAIGFVLLAAALQNTDGRV
ncbi:hypothetical protein FBQ82_18245 [Anaerolineae bacterium CFX7]|nr:hypothetical protein [Anaerolineae bacterium CFX7]